MTVEGDHFKLHLEITNEIQDVTCTFITRDIGTFPATKSIYTECNGSTHIKSVELGYNI